MLEKSQYGEAQREMDETQPGSPVIGRPLNAGARRRFSRIDEVTLNGPTTQGKAFLGQGDFGDGRDGEAGITNGREIPSL